QEAAYSLIPERSRAEAHVRIGRLLVAHTPPEMREELIFEIVNQLNRGVALITSWDEREQLAELDLIAGKRAKNATAYASALTYLAAGRALLSEDCWDRCGALGSQGAAPPGKEEVRREYERLWRQIESRSIEDLVHLPLMTDPEARATMD